MLVPLKLKPNLERETRFHTRFYKVFNLDCVDDSTADIKIENLIQEGAPPLNPDAPITNLETLCEFQEVPVFHGGDRAYYSPSLDRISMPQFKYFSSAIAYYSTKLHELAHSSGHRKRLNRDLSGAFGSIKYAKEELIAELTSVLVASELGIKEELELENHASYLASWIKVLKEDSKALFTALSHARGASNYLLNNYQEKLCQN